jgi:hypothetical protein
LRCSVFDHHAGDVNEAKLLRVLSKGHLAYEINEFVVDAERLPSVRTTEYNNPVLEAFLIHARVLLDFFYAKADAPERPRPGNQAYAFQFVEGGEEAWDEIAPRDKCKELFGHDLQDLYTTISTRIGHLTVERLDKVGWYGDDIVRGLTHLISVWHENLTADAKAAFDAGQRFESERAAERGTPWIGVPEERTGRARLSYTRLADP